MHQVGMKNDSIEMKKNIEGMKEMYRVEMKKRD